MWEIKGGPVVRHGAFRFYTVRDTERVRVATFRKWRRSSKGEMVARVRRHRAAGKKHHAA